MRNITLDLSQSQRCSPKVFAGYEGEHNATNMTVILPEELLSLNEVTVLTPYFKTSYGEEFSLTPISLSEVSGNTIEILLSQPITKMGESRCQIEGVDNNGDVVMKTSTGILIFGDSIDAIGENADLIIVNPKTINILAAMMGGYGVNSILLNDINSNAAIGDNSISAGCNTVAGSKYFKIPAQKLTLSNGIYSLKIEGLLSSDDIDNTDTAIMRFESWYYCTDIIVKSFNEEDNTTEISFRCPYITSDEKVLVDGHVLSSDNSKESVFCIVGKTELGNYNLGLSAFVGGNGNIAANEGSVSLGQDNKVYGNNAVVMGRDNFAVYQGVALGRSNKIYKETAVGIGQGNIISHQVGVGIGRQNQISGQYAVGIGNQCVVKPQAGIAVGNNATVEDDGVLALGKLATSNSNTKVAINNNAGKYYFEVGSIDGNKSSAQNYLGLDPECIDLGVGNTMPKNTGSSRYNVVIGSYNDYKGSGSILIGHKNKATESAIYGIAFGENLTLQHEHDIVIGNNAQALNKHNISIGYKTYTSGLGATAIGWENYATGLFAAAFGKTNIASGQSQFVIGEANARDDNALFVVGNGNSNNATIGSFDNSPGRSNAFVVRKTGQALLGSANILNDEKAVVTKKYVDDCLASLRAELGLNS